MRSTASLALVLLLTGCARLPLVADPDCAALFAARDAVSTATQDAQYQRLAGFPGLRSDRVLAALGPTAHSPAQRLLWLQRLAAKDAEASIIELGNLPEPPRTAWTIPARQQQLSACRTATITQLMHDASAFERAVAAAQVDDDYSGWARRLGLYPLFRPLYRQQVAHWQDHVATLQAPTSSPHWLAYQPLIGVEPNASGLSSDALGLPQADPAQLAALFARHAPWLNIEQLSPADRIGSPLFDADGRRDFALQQPQVFQHVGWSQLDGHWHLQLIYQFWFARRPKPQPLDLYGGELDGLIWRVTLDDQGQALLYDSIHPCGCWHSLFLPNSSPLRPQAATDHEARLVRRLPIDGRSGATLWLSGGEHQLRWVDGRRPTSPTVSYRRTALDSLRQLAHPQGSHSLYDGAGLVPGSERLERWLLWPSGINSPGAMRQWGRHATAFVGQAEFDDPQLLQGYFAAP